MFKMIKEKAINQKYSGENLHGFFLFFFAFSFFEIFKRFKSVLFIV